MNPVTNEKLNRENKISNGMNSQAALDKIETVEKESDKILAQAKEQAQEILKEAELEKERLIKEAKEKAKAFIERLKKEMQVEIKREIDLIQDRTEEETHALKEKAGANLDKAVEFIREIAD